MLGNRLLSFRHCHSVEVFSVVHIEIEAFLFLVLVAHIILLVFRRITLLSFLFCRRSGLLTGSLRQNISMLRYMRRTLISINNNLRSRLRLFLCFFLLRVSNCTKQLAGEGFSSGHGRVKGFSWKPGGPRSSFLLHFRLHLFDDLLQNFDLFVKLLVFF